MKNSNENINNVHLSTFKRRKSLRNKFSYFESIGNTQVSGLFIWSKVQILALQLLVKSWANYSIYEFYFSYMQYLANNGNSYKICCEN